MDKQELNTRLDRINFWLSNCDQKCSIVLAFIGILLTTLLNPDILNTLHSNLIVPVYMAIKGDSTMVFSFVNLLVILDLITLVISITYSILQLVWALLARVNPADFEQSGLTYRKTLLHFSSIAHKSYEDYKKQCENCSDEAEKNDYISQIYINSKIGDLKYGHYNNGIKALVVTIITFVLLWFYLFLI